MSSPLPDKGPWAGPAHTDDEVRALRDAFELYTQTTKALEESYRRLEERLRTLDQELQAKNQELALTTDYLNSILDSMSDGVIAVDTEGVITTFNNAAARVLGYAPEDVAGRPFGEVFGRQFAPGPGRGVMELRAKGGEAVPVSERNSPIADRAGLRIGQVKVFQDLREIETLREQVRRKDRLAALGEMAATVAHEIRNPLGGIRGFATLLQRDIPEDDPRARLVEKIITGTKNLDRVVNELLEYTRPVELELQTVRCAEVVDAALGDLHYAGGPVRLINRVPDDLIAFADPGKLRQTLLNILLNAVQSIDGEGEVVVTGENDGDTVVLAVRDTGCGIPEDRLGRLFSPFYTTKEKGTGLGLAVAAKIIESHGGALEVTSAVGAGSEFRLKLPGGE